MSNQDLQFKEPQNPLLNYHKTIGAIFKERKRILQALNEKFREKKHLAHSNDPSNPKERKSEIEVQDKLRKLIKK